MRSALFATSYLLFPFCLLTLPTTYAICVGLLETTLRNSSIRHARITKLTKRDAEFFRAFAKNKSLTRAEFNKAHPIKPVKKPLAGFDTPRDFTSPATGLEKIYRALAEYTAKFPAVKRKNLVFCGATGTGKTRAAQILFNALLNKKIDVLYTTAFGLVQSFQKYVNTFGRDTDEIDRFLECGLLIIDDLGTEPVIKNVSQEHIYNVLNERLLKNRAFLITTNLDPNTIMERYDERIASRILSTETSTVIEFRGSDMRLNPAKK